MKLALAKGTTSATVYIFVQDSSVTTGAGLTGLAYNTSSLVAYYVRPLASATAITLATQTVTGAYSSGGFVEVDSTNMPGVYRLDLPNAVLATGVGSVVVMLKGASNMAPVLLEIQLTDIDLNDGVRGGMTALPNAAADAAGGLPISDAGGLALDTLDSNVSAILTDTAEIGVAGAGLTNITLNAASIDLIWDEATSGHTTTGTTGKALSDAGSAGDPWSTSLPGAYGAGTAGKIVGDNLNATVSSRLASSSYTAPDNATITAIAGYVDTEVAAIKAVTDNLPDSGALTTITTHLTDIKGGTFSGATDSLEALRNRGDAAWITATGFSTHSATDVWSVGTRVLTSNTNLNDLDTAGVRAAVGLASANLDTQIGTIDTNVDAIKAKTDSLTYTVAGQVDANIQYVNDTAITGNGGSGTEWGPA